MTAHRTTAPAEPEHADVRAVRQRGPVGPAAQLLALQRQAGNRGVVEALRSSTAPTVQRNWLGDAASWVGDKASSAAGAVADAAGYVGDRVGDALDVRGNEAMRDFQEDREALREWKAEGTRGPENMRAPTGIGGFGAAYDPAFQLLLIRLAGGALFLDSITFAGDLAVVSHPNPGAALTGFVAQVNRLPAAQRRAAAAPYLWTDGERTGFLTTFNAGVKSRWSEKHQFHSTEDNWTDLGANVQVDAALHAGAKGEDEHMSLTAYKTPPGGAGNVGVVQSGTGGAAGVFSGAARATDNAMVLNSPDVAPRADNLLQSGGRFPPGARDLDTAGTSALMAIGATFRGGGPGCRICGVTITASSGGPSLSFRVAGATEAAARERFSSLMTALTVGGNRDIAVRSVFAYDGVGDGYRVVAGDGLAQTVAEHEAGHMFGLGDEYATGEGSNISGTGKAAGDTAKHDDLVQEMGLSGAVHENNDGIMSLGSVVRPQHYATFFWALGELTGIDWALGPPVPVRPPGASPMGDFPTPERDPVTATV